MQEIKNDFYLIETCRAFSSRDCPNRAAAEQNAPDYLRKLVESSHWHKIMSAGLEKDLKPHQKLKISLAGCPNGCSRPHIHDLGLIGAGFPLVYKSSCTGCGNCVEACRENAVGLHQDMAVIDHERCLGCKECIRACPDGALCAGKQGYRIVVGGKLGRRPVLASELNGVYSLKQAEAVLDKVLEWHRQAFANGLRVNHVMDLESIS